MHIKMPFRSNRGTALIMVILIVAVMSLLGISLVAVTLSGFKMSIFYSESNKAYFAAEAAVEQVAGILDQRVANRQEYARVQASDYVQGLLRDDPNYIRNSDGTIKQTVFDAEFRTKYLESFYTGLEDEFRNIDTEYLKGLLNTEAVGADGKAYKDIGADKERMILESACYNSTDLKLGIAVTGICGDSRRRLDVTFNLLPDSGKIPYKDIQKSVLNKKRTLPPVFGKAVVAEKNMIAAGGHVSIDGDVLCFGTVPAGEGGEEDQDAPWYRYGGIMAGISGDVAGNSGELDFNANKTGSFVGGSILINGNAATMAYVHSIYGTDANPSNITIKGKTFARAIKSEKSSNFSVIDLQGDVYTTDNLQIDSSGTNMNIQGKYYGFVDAGYMIDGSGADTPGKTLKDEILFKRTSSIVVNGDSYLNMNNEIYVGGSTFFREISDEDGYPYMSGISAMKSSKRTVNAFKKDDAANPGNTLYWYENGAYAATPPAPAFKAYSDPGGLKEMFAGRSTDPGRFTITNRAMHFKGVWDNLWKNDYIFSSYINPDNINISGNGIAADGKLKGYSNGAIIANGKVFGIDEFEEGHDPVRFHAVQQQCIRDYHSAVQDLLTENYSAAAPRLDYVKPTKHLSDYLNTGSIYSGTAKIKADEPYVVPEAGIFFYGSRDTEITFNGGRWYIGGKEMPVCKGIIYVDGNLYVGGGFNFKGMLMASKNIVFLGDSDIAYDETVNRLFDNDVNINDFFNLLVCEVPDEKLKSQRISSKNISIDKWDEMPVY